MARMRVIGSSFDKGYRDDLNYNFGLLESLIGEANGLTDAFRQEMLKQINNLQQQIDILTGEDIGALLARINDSIQQALTAAQEARTAKSATEQATTLAKTATELAKASALLAEEKANYANEKAVLAQEAANHANQESSNLSQLKAEAVQATQDANTAASNANEKAAFANTAAYTATQSAEAADEATNRANTAAEAIEGWSGVVDWLPGTYDKNNNVTYNGSTFQARKDGVSSKPPQPPVSNEDWMVIAQRGVDGTGAVSSVNNKMPETNGNVSVSWVDIPNKPLEYPPASHTHNVNDINGLQEVLDGKSNNSELASLEDVLTNHIDEMDYIGLGNFNGKAGIKRGEHAVDFQSVRNSDDQVASSYASFIAGGANNIIKNIIERDSNAQYSHVENLGNRALDWGAHVEGYYCIVDGKISHAEGNAVICTANDSHAEGNRTVAGRRYYPNVTFGIEDAGSGLGTLNFVLIPPIEGDVSPFFPNALTDVARYGSGTQKDSKGNIYPSGMTPAIWNGDTVVKPNDLQWAMHPICIVRGQSESALEFVAIAKTVYNASIGTKVYYYGDNPLGTLIGIYSSYAPTVSILERGTDTQGGNGLHSEGFFTSAWGYGSHAEGSFTRAWAYAAHAEGRDTQALGYASHAEGFQTVALAPYAHSQGFQTEASGEASFAAGNNAKAWRKNQRSFAVGNIKSRGDNQLSEIQYTHRLPNVGWHVLMILENMEVGKAYHFETMTTGRQISGTAGSAGHTFAYKFSGCVVRLDTTSYEVLGTPTRTLVGRSTGMSGDGLSTGVRVNWDTNYLTNVNASGNQKNAIYLRMDGLDNTTFQVTTYNKIQEMGM